MYICAQIKKIMINHILFISGGELVLVMLLALLFFGSKAIPDIAKTLGKGMREFRKATNEIQRELNEHTSDIKRDINDMKATVNRETTKIKKDLDNVSSTVEKETSEIKHNIEESASFEEKKSKVGNKGTSNSTEDNIQAN